MLSFAVLFSLLALILLLGSFYFRRYQVTRPPIGVLNFYDIAMMIVMIVLIPYLYLFVPVWVAGGLLLLGAVSILQLLWEPLLRSPWLVWGIVALLLASDLAASYFFGHDNRFFAVNNILIALLVIGASNLWAQSGMKGRNLIVLGAALAIYDIWATTYLSLTGDMFNRLGGLALAPQIIWGSGINQASIGLGDLLLATVFPLVMRKAFGRTAWAVAVVLTLAAFIFMALLPFKTIFPAMVVLGPLMWPQYFYWRHRYGKERTTKEYLLAEPLLDRGVATATLSA